MQYIMSSFVFPLNCNNYTLQSFYGYCKLSGGRGNFLGQKKADSLLKEEISLLETKLCLV